MKNYDIAAFVWPSYTGDEPRTRIFWPDGIGEWQTVKAMTDKGYEGCRWPRVPLWGYENEADSTVMEKQIKCAVEHGVNVFIYDWYWYDNRPFLENCLNDGFLKAKNNTDMRFCLMWANHNATHLWDKRNSDEFPDTVIWNGVVTPEIFSDVCDRIIEKYFKRDNYYCIDGCPVFCVFDIDNLIRSFGTSDELKKGIEQFRQKTIDAGFKGLHLQFIYWRDRVFNWLRDDDSQKGVYPVQMYDYLGASSVTNYSWGGITDFDGDFNRIADSYVEEYTKAAKGLNVAYYPNISVGWDNNVRFKDFMPGVVVNNTPENFKVACEKIKKLTDEGIEGGALKAPFITVNSWNEWTETSYLLPDDLYGFGYLEAIKEVFTEE
ncbi:MAG: glycoside hydrolase family 99-like domain-containing protein [Clostridia bacterium]|nr:glycoside hydrolase family 99-like domain-containing protein [Clostridia bacterium]